MPAKAFEDFAVHTRHVAEFFPKTADAVNASARHGISQSAVQKAGDAESQTVRRVDVGPIHDLLSESRALPIKGIDPRNPGMRKIFSAFPVGDSDDTNGEGGYLYVVLGGSQYEAVAEQVSGSVCLRAIFLDCRNPPEFPESGSFWRVTGGKTATGDRS